MDLPFFKKLKKGYSSLWQAFIRPPRQFYTPEELGSRFITLDNNFQIIRQDKKLFCKNTRLIECSHFIPKHLQAQKIPCIVYLHGNSGSRLEAFQLVEIILQQDISLFCFDFSGSGLSDGEYITLGYNEKEDLQCVIENLRSLSTVSEIGIWGRSMGAVTAILYSELDQESVTCQVLDSAYSDLMLLAKEFGKENLNFPNFFIDIGLGMITKSIKEKIGVDIFQLKPIDCVNKNNIPAFFICTEDDKLVRKHHTESLFERYKGPKKFACVPGGHNTERPLDLINDIISFFKTNFSKKYNPMLHLGHSVNTSSRQNIHIILPNQAIQNKTQPTYYSPQTNIVTQNPADFKTEPISKVISPSLLPSPLLPEHLSNSPHERSKSRKIRVQERKNNSTLNNSNGSIHNSLDLTLPQNQYNFALKTEASVKQDQNPVPNKPYTRIKNKFQITQEQE